MQIIPLKLLILMVMNLLNLIMALLLIIATVCKSLSRNLTCLHRQLYKIRLLTSLLL
nr:MAG TPA: hypothetical protein [Crassvirales sp.]